MDIQFLLMRQISEFYDKIQSVNDIIPREAVWPSADNKIKVAVGMRRAGKTYFIYHTIQQLLANNISLSRVLYLNFEDDRLLPLSQEKLAQLLEAFYALYPENHNQRCYLFLDEIQNVPDWSIVVRRFFDTKDVAIYLTGSSAKLLSKEIATSLRGRSLVTEIWPFSFSEFLRAKNITFDSKLFDQKKQDQLTKHFQDYLLGGGFPETIAYDSDTRLQTLQEYVEVAMYRDIVERHRVTSIASLKYMILFMITHAGRPFSINKFYHDLKTQGYQVTKDSLYDFACYIEDAYLAFSVGLYDSSIRKIASNPKKLYAVDPGLVSALQFNPQKKICQLFENVVFLDLKRQGCKIYYYLTTERYEVDFLVQTPQGKQKLLQVCWDSSNAETLARETRALRSAQEALQIDGEIITLQRYLAQGVFV